MYIIEQIRSKFQKALINFAKESDLKPAEIQIVINAEDNDFVLRYTLLNKYDFKKTITFLEILNVDIDFLGYEQMVILFLESTFKTLAKENGCEINEISIMIYTNDDEIKLLVCLYKCLDGKYQEIKKLDFSKDLFMEDENLIPNSTT